MQLFLTDTIHPTCWGNKSIAVVGVSLQTINENYHNNEGHTTRELTAFSIALRVAVGVLDWLRSTFFQSLYDNWISELSVCKICIQIDERLQKNFEKYTFSDLKYHV